MNVRGRIESALTTIVEATKESGVAWVVGGSAGLMLRGVSLPNEPRDLDIYSDEADIDRLYNMLLQYAVDKPQLNESGIYRSKLCHFLIAGISVEIVGGFVVQAHGCRYVTEVESLLLPYSERIRLSEDIVVPVVPLAHELWFNVLRDRADRSQVIIETYYREEDRHREAMEKLEYRNGFSQDMTRRVHSWIANQQVEAK